MMKLMLKLFRSQGGFAHLLGILVVILLIAGIGFGIYLTLQRTNLKSRAGGEVPETSFTLVGRTDNNDNIIKPTISTPILGGNQNLTFNTEPNETFYVDILVKSNTSAVNLIAAQLKYPTNLLQVEGIKIDKGQVLGESIAQNPDFIHDISCSAYQDMQIPPTGTVNQQIRVFPSWQGGTPGCGNQYFFTYQGSEVPSQTRLGTNPINLTYSSPGQKELNITVRGNGSCVNDTTSVGMTGTCTIDVAAASAPQLCTPNQPRANDATGPEGQSVQVVCNDTGTDYRYRPCTMGCSQGYFCDGAHCIAQPECAGKTSGTVCTGGSCDGNGRCVSVGTPLPTPSPPLLSEPISNIDPIFFIDSWLDNSSNNQTGRISLIGGIPSPGYKNNVGDYGLMARVKFKVLPDTSGQIAKIEFLEADTEMYRNSDNQPIDTVIKRNLDVKISNPGWLTRPTTNNNNNEAVTNTQTSTSSAGPTARPIARTPDFNNNTKADLGDASFFLSNFKQGAYNQTIDLNNDQVINAVDFSLLVRYLIENNIISR